MAGREGGAKALLTPLAVLLAESSCALYSVAQLHNYIIIVQLSIRGDKKKKLVERQRIVPESGSSEIQILSG